MVDALLDDPIIDTLLSTACGKRSTKYASIVVVNAINKVMANIINTL
jgi:hypothetical protein